MARPKALPDEIKFGDLVHDIQSALDRAEAAHRMALAAHRQAGDKLLELSNALRTRAVGAMWRDQNFVEPAPQPIIAAIDREPASEPLLVSMREASRLTGLSRSTLYKRINEGVLDVRRTGRRIVIVRASLKVWIEGLAARGDERGRSR
jgi:excisionase family DNA binding protein